MAAVTVTFRRKQARLVTELKPGIPINPAEYMESA